MGMAYQLQVFAHLFRSLKGAPAWRASDKIALLS
jgi:hypothetical protein